MINDWMFKLALYGNTLDFNLFKRLSSTQNEINDIIDNNNFFCGDGILKGSPKKEPFTFLIGLPYLNNREVLQYFTPINKDRVLKEEDAYLESGRELEKFEGHHIYLKSQTLNESEIVTSYTSETAVNKHDVFTITTKENVLELKFIYGVLISKLYTYYQFLTSSSWGVGTRPAIRLKEYLSFPLVSPEKQEKEILVSLVDKFLKPFKDFYNSFNIGEPPINKLILSQIEALVSDWYEIENFEKDLIDYVINVSRYQFQESKQHLVSDFTHSENHYRNINYVIKEYANVYISEFEKIYYHEYLQVEVYLLDYFIALNFVFHKEEPNARIVYPRENNTEKEVLTRLANNLSISQITNTSDQSKNLFIQKDIKGFEENSFYIIKPKEYKCWHRAMAWYDVAEFKEAIENAELNIIKESANEF